MKRVLWIVLDSLGIGEMPDADRFGDKGSDTLRHIVEETKIRLPDMEALGLANIDGINYLPRVDKPRGAYARAGFLSDGKDTITGHWEMAGIVLDEPFQTYPNGFDAEIITGLEEQCGRKVIGNKAASGTKIIEELGEEHSATGAIIVYTSADSVFQIAAHEDVVPLDELYRICEAARAMLVGKHNVARVIARPFVGRSGQYVRTANRRDYAVSPPEKTVLDILQGGGAEVWAVGKIEDIFNKRGIDRAVHTAGNDDGIDKTLEFMAQPATKPTLVYTNLVDFDSKYRNDIYGYAQALVDFDKRLEEILRCLQKEDILILCADHGCDPKTPSSDHSREYVPILLYGAAVKPVNLGTLDSIADLGATVVDYLLGSSSTFGRSFLNQLI